MAWTTAVWNDEFKIEFDVVVRKDLDAKWSNIFHLTLMFIYDSHPYFWL